MSLNSAFVKVPRNDHEPGKGAWWTIDPECESQFTDGVYKKNRRPVAAKEKRTPYPPPEKTVRKRLISDNNDNNDGRSCKKISNHQISINDNNLQTNNNNCGIESIITAADNIGGKQDVILKTVSYYKTFLCLININTDNSIYKSKRMVFLLSLLPLPVLLCN